MPERREAYGAHPPQLLDDYLTRFRRGGRAALPGTAIRTRSLDARLLLARYAAEDAATLDELLAAARAHDGRWLRRRRKRIRPAALGDLARVMALQDLLPTDRSDALALYDLVLDVYGPRGLPPLHQGFHAQLAFLSGAGARAAELLRRYPDISEPARADLELDLTNPFVADRPWQPWLAQFCRHLPGPAVTVRPAVGADADATPFDRLVTATAPEPVDAPQRISVVVSAFRPDAGLATAVRSILAQSWTNLEVLVVDDASGPEYDPVLAECLALDPRVRLVKLSANSGTYVARNAALDAATGEFVTFQDSDDWSHPLRLQLQVQPLIADPALVASTSDGLSVTEDLLLSRAGIRSGRFNPSSLMLRRDVVVQRLGYFDTMRKAADSEFINRLGAVFGERALHHVAGGCLALIRLSPNSLSRSEIRAYWMHPARVAYSSAYLHWHTRIAAGAVDPYRPRDGSDRPFAVPAHLQRAGGAPPAPDVVLAGDWSVYGGTQQLMIDEIRGLATRGLRVAVLHLEAYLPMARRRQPLCRQIQDLINDGVVGQVLLTDDTAAGMVIVRQPAVLQFTSGEAARLRPRRVIIVADQAPTVRDGSRWRYAPEACALAVRRLFGIEPRWHSQDAGVRAALAAYLPPERLGPDLPGAIDAHRWERVDAGRRGARPVLGRDLRESLVNWAQERAALLAAYPNSTDLDVRLRGSVCSPQALLAKAGLPANWLVYDEAEVTARAFLHQLDFYVDFPSDNAVEAFGRPTLEALAAGCVVVLPHRFADTYADAAVYCGPDEVSQVVRRYWGDTALYRRQSDIARQRARERFHPDAYAERIIALLD